MKTVLVRLRDTTNPETGSRYTVKRCESEKAGDGDSDGDAWPHMKITLKPLDPGFDPIVLTAADEGEAAVVAELVDVSAADGD